MQMPRFFNRSRRQVAPEEDKKVRELRTDAVVLANEVFDQLEDSGFVSHSFGDQAFFNAFLAELSWIASRNRFGYVLLGIDPEDSFYAEFATPEWLLKKQIEAA